MNTKTNSKRCIACWESIPSQSSLCAKCGSFQRPWKNHLRYWSTIVGLGAFICTALAYIASMVPEAWRMMTWKDGVRVVDIIHPGYIILQNIGDGDVFVRKLHWTGTVTGTTHEMTSTDTIPINKKLSKSQGMESIELNSSEHRKRKFAGEYIRDHEIAKEIRMKLWANARSSDDQCWDIKIQLAKSESMLQTEREAKQEFWSVPIQGTLHFDSLHNNKPLEAHIDLLGFVVKNPNGKC